MVVALKKYSQHMGIECNQPITNEKVRILCENDMYMKMFIGTFLVQGGNNKNKNIHAHKWDKTSSWSISTCFQQQTHRIVSFSMDYLQIA